MAEQLPITDFDRQISYKLAIQLDEAGNLVFQNTLQNKKRMPECWRGDNSQKLVGLSDEELCRHAQKGCTKSHDLLWQRYHDFVKQVIRRESFKRQLPPAETADALQELYFAFREAIRHYAPENYYPERPASFKTLLNLILVRRFSNYCTCWRNYRKRIALGVREESLQYVVANTETPPYNNINGNEYSLMNLQKILHGELCSEGLVEAMLQLKPKEKFLLELWLEHGRDKKVAEVLGISVAAAKLRRTRLFRRLKKYSLVK